MTLYETMIWINKHLFDLWTIEKFEIFLKKDHHLSKIKWFLQYFEIKDNLTLDFQKIRKCGIKCFWNQSDKYQLSRHSTFITTKYAYCLSVMHGVTRMPL